MSISVEEVKRYFQEIAIALRREGFRTEPGARGRLGVWLDDHPICEVDQVGGITYRSDNIPTPELVTAKDKVCRIVCNIAEYMRQMKQAPTLKADGLAESYRLIEDFAQATIYQPIYGMDPMAGILPMDCVSVEDANELAQMIREMPDADLLKYLAVLSAEQPENFPSALRLALELDDYERITEGTYEYGQSVLRRIGADDEIIDAIDGYMDFEKLGEYSMLEDGVRQTEYGMVRRLSQPFSSRETNEMTMIN